MTTTRNTGTEKLPADDFADPSQDYKPEERYVLDPENLSEDNQALFEQLDRDVTSWRPEPGDRLVGKILSAVDTTSDYGTYPLIELDPGYGPIVQVHCFHTVLRNEVIRLHIREGDTLALEYRGRKGKNDTAYYRVVVRRGAGGKVYKPGADMPNVDVEEPF